MSKVRLRLYKRPRKEKRSDPEREEEREQVPLQVEKKKEAEKNKIKKDEIRGKKCHAKTDVQKRTPHGSSFLRSTTDKTRVKGNTYIEYMRVSLQ